MIVAGHPLPPLLAEKTDPGLVAWRAGLAQEVADVLARWHLTPCPPFVPGGSASWVAPVTGPDGAPRVLKVAWAHEEARDEAAAMAAWQGHGAARVDRAERRGDTSLLLMEQVRPGTPLQELMPGPDGDEVIAGLLRRLWIRPPAATFRPLSHMCRWWADEAARRLAGSGLLPADLVEHGLDLFRSLPQRWDGDPVLLATDLHHGNVLAADGAAGPVAPGPPGGGRWVLIDPKPYVGDPHYDVLQHMLNDPERLTADPAAFADRMAGLTGLDPQRTRHWLLARCVQEAGVIDGAREAALRLARDGIA